jgi:hypothetical protein
VGFDAESCRTKHGLHARTIRNPPIGLVVRVAMLNEVHLGIGRLVKRCGFVKSQSASTSIKSRLPRCMLWKTIRSLATCS